MTTNRRTFLTQAASALALASSSNLVQADQPKKETTGSHAERPTRINRIAVSTYSFWQFKNANLRDIEKNIDLAADMGADPKEVKAAIRVMQSGRADLIIEILAARMSVRSALANAIQQKPLHRHVTTKSND